jgi:hypothetical protein
MVLGNAFTPFRAMAEIAAFVREEAARPKLAHRVGAVDAALPKKVCS